MTKRQSGDRYNSGSDDWGYFVRTSVKTLMDLVSKAMDTSPKELRNNRQELRVVHARSIVAVLGAELLPVTHIQIEDGLLRGKGMVHWYLARHADRMKLYPEYAERFAHCRALALIEFPTVRRQLPPGQTVDAAAPAAAGLALPQCQPSIPPPAHKK